MTVATLLFTVLSVIKTLTANLEFGHCPSFVPTVPISSENFDGRWFEIKKTKNFIQERFDGGTCSYFDMTVTSNFLTGPEVVIKSTAYNDNSPKTKRFSAPTSDWGYQNGQYSGQLRVNFRDFTSDPEKPNMFILHADEDFVVIYFCESSGPFKLSLAWVLAKSSTPNFGALKMIERKLASFNLVNVNKMQYVDQSNCPIKQMPSGLTNSLQMLPAKEESKGPDLMFIRCMMQISDTHFYDVSYCKEKSRRLSSDFSELKKD